MAIHKLGADLKDFKASCGFEICLMSRDAWQFPGRLYNIYGMTSREALQIFGKLASELVKRTKHLGCKYSIREYALKNMLIAYVWKSFGRY